MPCVEPFFRCLLLASALAASPSRDPSLRPPPERSTPDGLALLREMQEGLGGAEKIAAIHDLEETIRAEARDSRGSSLGAVRKRTRWIQDPATLLRAIAGLLLGRIDSPVTGTRGLVGGG